MDGIRKKEEKVNSRNLTTKIEKGNFGFEKEDGTFNSPPTSGLMMYGCVNDELISNRWSLRTRFIEC
jgi:hypothetical protein